MFPTYSLKLAWMYRLTPPANCGSGTWGVFVRPVVFTSPSSEEDFPDTVVENAPQATKKQQRGEWEKEFKF